jgi:hypothetical protein
VGGALSLVPIPGASLVGRTIGLAGRIGTGVAAAKGAGALATRLIPSLRGGPLTTGSLMAMTPKKKYRRMNPMNAKAARRAIRRIKAVRKITHDIEAQLPRARASRKVCPPKR